MADRDALPLLRAQWRNVVMLNYEIAGGVLQPLVPAGTELDDFHGRLFISLIGFQFLKASLLHIPIPLHQHFVEVNLRFYVKRKAPDGWHHGVVFIREMVPRRAVSLGAALLYNEPYRTVPLREHVHMDGAASGAPGHVRYEWHLHQQWQHLEATTEGTPTPLEPGSEADFIATRHWGFGTFHGGRGIEYHVTHPRWNIWKVHRHSLRCDVAELYGQRFVAPLSQPPASVFMADGSEVSVSRWRGL
jgi:uncharacterized protein YqjF (DUF2071 family)